MTKKNNSIQMDKDQPVFVGLDVHKKTWTVCIIHQNEIIRKITLPGKFDALEKILSKYQVHRIESVYEERVFWILSTR